MTDNEYKAFKHICQLSPAQLQVELYEYLSTIYDKNMMRVTKDYIVAVGDIDIALVAHLDTVFPETSLDIFYDREQQVIWGDSGLGADDRAGVYAILAILRDGFRPSVIFTLGEERGGLGAQKLAKDCPNLPIPSLKYMIELDRQGYNDCVFYSCSNTDFRKYVEAFGFETQLGSYTDISFLMDVWDVAGVNLSIGYVDEHSYCERLYVRWMERTIEAVKIMLQSKSPKFKWEQWLNV